MGLWQGFENRRWLAKENTHGGLWGRAQTAKHIGPQSGGCGWETCEEANTVSSYCLGFSSTKGAKYSLIFASFKISQTRLISMEDEMGGWVEPRLCPPHQVQHGNEGICCLEYCVSSELSKLHHPIHGRSENNARYSLNFLELKKGEW